MIYLVIALLILFIHWFIISNSLAPWMPSKKKDYARIQELVELQPNQVFYELGCGDGRICRSLAEKYPASTFIGIERDLIMYAYCRAKNLLNSQKNIKYIRKNALHIDLSNADCIYIYGMPSALKKAFRHKFETNLKNGCKIVSYLFPIDPWKPSIVSQPTKKDMKIWVYHMNIEQGISNDELF